MDQKTAKHLKFNYLKMQQGLEYQKSLISYKRCENLE